MAGQQVETKRTYCRVCMTQCGLVADVVGDQIVKIRGDREHPITRGYTCPKGRATDRIHHHPDAITRPLMRKHGELVAVGWDEALDDIAAMLRASSTRMDPTRLASISVAVWVSIPRATPWRTLSTAHSADRPSSPR